MLTQRTFSFTFLKCAQERTYNIKVNCVLMQSKLRKLHYYYIIFSIFKIPTLHTIATRSNALSFYSLLHNTLI